MTAPRTLPITFDDALAACVARWGAPATLIRDDGQSGNPHRPAFHSATWLVGHCGANLDVLDGPLTLRAWVERARPPQVVAWTLAGEPADGEPMATVADAIDAAVTWIAAREAERRAAWAAAQQLPLAGVA